MATNTTSVNNKDCQIYDTSPTFNYGAVDALNIRKTGGAERLRTLIKFTLPAGSGTISKITLTLTKSTSLTATGNVEAHEITQSGWTEGTGSGSATGDGATWNTYNGSSNWATGGGDYSGTIINTVADPANVGDLLNIDLLGGSATNSISVTWGGTVELLLKQVTETGGTDTGGIYYSKENGTPSNRPYLTITYTLDSAFLLQMI